MKAAACLLQDTSALQSLRGDDTVNTVFETPSACSNLSAALPSNGRYNPQAVSQIYNPLSPTDSCATSGFKVRGTFIAP
jgi:hypothetical protein